MKYGPARLRYERRKRRREQLQAFAWLWNLLSVVFSVATVFAAGWFIWKMAHPANAVKTINSVPSPTVNYPVYATNLPTLKPSPGPTNTKIIETPTAVPPTPEDTSLYTFDLQAKPESISATLFKQERTCNWSGIAGQVFDLQGRPITGITVQVDGPMYGKNIKFLNITGSSPWYGVGGYEIFLTDKPVDTQGEYGIRLVDQNGRSLSPRFKFNTSSDCAKNLVIVNFRQIK
ncbi:hypothetical protein hrd7_24850 [Leptolinea sp. HRD-7]|nr:hypothetical protein hrd7_24850 [Leptolinea sp. HRD-7]